MDRPGRDTQSPAYRADIDGLRAISILLVLGYHADLGPFPGGFVGVDVFFVISGFLITGILLRELEAGHFSPAGFYARRVRRIFPALIVVLAATVLIGWFVLLPDGFSLLGKSIAAGVLFASNLFQLTQVGYFAPDAAENPLVHLWSLGIEEQFYIFWPPLLWLLSGAKRRGFWMAVIAAVSFGVSLMIFFGSRDIAFYSPISRAWELLAGGMIANRFVSDPKAERRGSAARDNWCGTMGLVAILGAAIGLNKDSLFPGVYALAPVLGAVLVIVSPNSWVNRTLLSNRAMVGIGLISYPLYLWHWPLLSYLTIIRNNDPTMLEVWVTLIVAFALAWLTWRFVEIPLRRRPRVVPKLSFGLIAVGVIGILTASASGFGFRFPPEIRDIAALQPLNNAGMRDECFSEARGARLGPNCIEPSEKPLLFVWGDSTSAALYPGLKTAEARIPFRLARFASPACAPILASGSDCDAFNDLVFGFIRSSRPQIVLLHAMWDKKNDLDKLMQTVRQLRAVGIPRIVVLGPEPVWKRMLPHTLVNNYRFRHQIADRLANGVSGPEIDQRMEAFSRAAGVEYLSAWHILCNEQGRERGCLTRIGPTAGDVVAVDNVHLSDAGANFLIQAIESDLFPQPQFPRDRSNSDRPD